MIPEQVMHELRYIEVYTGKKIRNQRVVDSSCLGSSGALSSVHSEPFQ